MNLRNNMIRAFESSDMNYGDTLPISRRKYSQKPIIPPLSPRANPSSRGFYEARSGPPG